MGEAKRRGTFEERKAAAIKRNEEMRRLKRQEKIIELAAMTPEEIRIKEKIQSEILRLLSIFGGILSIYRI